VQGKSELTGTDQPIKLSSNECCFGPSPVAIDAFRSSAKVLHRYADGAQTELRKAIARAHGLDADNVLCGNGSEELIGLLMRTFVAEGDELLLSENHFVMCSIYGTAQGAKIVLVRERDFKADVDAILKQISARTKMIALANPNNPTGTYLNVTEMQRLIDGVPPHVILLLDGAYAEYVTESDFDPGTRWIDTSQNIVMTRTFSKIYGLAALRIGWAYGPSNIIDFVNRLRSPFNASRPAMAAAAAALDDVDHVSRVREHTRRSLNRIGTELAALGVRVSPSVANFYLVNFDGTATRNASGAAAWLEARGIIPRPAGAGNYLRITVGTDEENDAVIDALRGYMEA
jgi:histidinol-phosphate aminotransferase